MQGIIVQQGGKGSHNTYNRANIGPKYEHQHLLKRQFNYAQICAILWN